PRPRTSAPACGCGCWSKCSSGCRWRWPPAAASGGGPGCPGGGCGGSGPAADAHPQRCPLCSLRPRGPSAESDRVSTERSGSRIGGGFSRARARTGPPWGRLEHVAESSVLPLVSVIVVNYRGAEDTTTCLRSLHTELDYPADRLEVVCVDNASGDGSAERIRSAFPQVRLIESETNLGFAGGCNLAARNASGEVLAFLNNDARPDRNWVRAAVDLLRAEPTVGAVASKVLDWEGRHIDFVDGGLTWFGMGYKRH